MFMNGDCGIIGRKPGGREGRKECGNWHINRGKETSILSYRLHDPAQVSTKGKYKDTTLKPFEIHPNITINHRWANRPPTKAPASAYIYAMRAREKKGNRPPSTIHVSAIQFSIEFYVILICCYCVAAWMFGCAESVWFIRYFYTSGQVTLINHCVFNIGFCVAFPTNTHSYISHLTATNRSHLTSHWLPYEIRLLFHFYFVYPFY